MTKTQLIAEIEEIKEEMTRLNDELSSSPTRLQAAFINEDLQYYTKELNQLVAKLNLINN